MAYEGYYLQIVHPFDHHKTGKKYTKGMMITDPAEVEMLHEDKEHHFIRIAAPSPGNPPVLFQDLSQAAAAYKDKAASESEDKDNA